MTRAIRCSQWVLSGLVLGIGVFGGQPARAELPTSVAIADPSEADLAAPLDRKKVVRAAVARNPAIRASEQRAQAMEREAGAEGSLPAPEAMAQVWQVPISRPYALDTQMIMIGLTQNFPAPGSRAAQEQAMTAQARAEHAMATDRARQIARDAGHAFTDYFESTAKHRVHRAHLAIGRHLLDIARARHDAGGSLTDLTKAEVELSRIEAQVVTDATLVQSARARINALLRREPKAPLGEPSEGEPQLPAWDTRTLVAKAHEMRPELRAAASVREAQQMKLRAAEHEATWPSFSLGALYFPPTQMNRSHAYGASASVSLPWLWGPTGDRRAAERKYLDAATTNLDAAQIPIDSEVVTAEAMAQSAAYRFQVLHDRAKPASQRALQVAQAGYESGRTDLLMVLDARRSTVDVDEDMVMARSALDHSLTDLDAAVGMEVPTQPISGIDTESLIHGGSHVR